jgi:hypothetical protein
MKYRWWTATERKKGPVGCSIRSALTKGHLFHKIEKIKQQYRNISFYYKFPNTTCWRPQTCSGSSACSTSASPHLPPGTYSLSRSTIM